MNQNFKNILEDLKNRHPRVPVYVDSIVRHGDGLVVLYSVGIVIEENDKVERRVAAYDGAGKQQKFTQVSF